jgi:hypothetical protein
MPEDSVSRNQQFRSGADNIDDGVHPHSTVHFDPEIQAAFFSTPH